MVQTLPKSTTQLSLYQANPKTDGHLTFDIEKMLNENWNKIDQDAQKQAEIGTKVDQIGQNLEFRSAQTWEMEEGVQALQTSCPISLGFQECRGRTFLNLAGEAGTFASISPWQMINEASAISVVEPSQKESVKSLRVTVGSGQTTAGIERTISDNLQSEKRYLIAAHIRTSSPSGVVTLEAFGVKVRHPLGLIWLKERYVVGSDRIRIYLDGANAGDHFSIESLRIYELSDEDFIKLDTQTDADITKLFPYVQGIAYKETPFAFVQGRNMCPSFEKWLFDTAEKSKITPRTLILTETNLRAYTTLIRVVPNQTYHFSLSAMSNGYIQFQFYNDKRISLQSVEMRDMLSKSFTIPVQTTFIQIVAISTAPSAAFTNLMLQYSEKIDEFTPPYQSLATLKTDFYSNLTGTIYDEFEDGYKISRILRTPLESSYTYTSSSSSGDLRTIAVSGILHLGIEPFGIGFSQQPLLTGEDKVNRVKVNGGQLLVTLSNLVAGWAPTYTPTSAEIAAYFLGYQMKISTGGVYAGVGEKAWVSLRDLTTTVSQLPTTAQLDPYLIFHTATKSRYEDAQSTSAWTQTGFNHVWVGTGMQLNESIVSGSPKYPIDTAIQYRMGEKKGSVSFLSYPYQIDYVASHSKLPGKFKLTGEVNLRSSFEKLSQRTNESLYQLFTTVDNGKTQVKTAIIAKGGTVKGTTPHSFEELSQGVQSIVKGSGNAQPVDVLEEKTFSNDTGLLIGVMPNKTNSVNTGTTPRTMSGYLKVDIPKGAYLNESNEVRIAASSLVPENIPIHKQIFDVVGTRLNRTSYNEYNRTFVAFAGKKIFCDSGYIWVALKENGALNETLYKIRPGGTTIAEAISTLTLPTYSSDNIRPVLTDVVNGMFVAADSKNSVVMRVAVYTSKGALLQLNSLANEATASPGDFQVSTVTVSQDAKMTYYAKGLSSSQVFYAYTSTGSLKYSQSVGGSLKVTPIENNSFILIDTTTRIATQYDSVFVRTEVSAISALTILFRG